MINFYCLGEKEKQAMEVFLLACCNGIDSHARAKEMRQVSCSLKKSLPEGDELDQMIEKKIQEILQIKSHSNENSDLKRTLTTVEHYCRADLGERKLRFAMTPSEQPSMMIHPTAASCLAGSVHLGNTIAMRELGKRLLAGQDVQQDEDKGCALLERAVQLEDTEATIELARFYGNNSQDPKNKEKMDDLLEQAMQFENKKSLCLFAQTLCQESKNPSDWTIGQMILNKFADLGDPEAIYALTSLTENKNPGESENLSPINLAELQQTKKRKHESLTLEGFIK